MKNSKFKTSVIVLGMITLMSCEKKVVVQQESPNSGVANNVVSSSNVANSTTVQEELPAGIQTFLNTHYPNITIANYEIKNVPIIGKTFEVKLNNGAEIEFKEDGTWQEISDGMGVPDALIPTNVKPYLETNYKGIKVKSIDIDKNKISIDLLNGIDLEFDSNGKFLKIDQ